MITQETYSLSKFPVYNTLLLTLVVKLYIRSSELTHLLIKVVGLINIFPLPHLPGPSRTHYTVYYYKFDFFFFFLYLTYKRDHTVFVSLHLVYFT